MINSVNRGGVDVAWTLIFCFQGVTHDLISSVSEMSVVFWIVVLFSFSSWYDMIVRVKWLVYAVWSDEEDSIGFLSVGVDIFDQLYLKERPISLPMMKMVTIKKYMINEIMWENSTTLKYIKFFMNNQNIMFGLSPPYGKTRKSGKMLDNIFWWMLRILFLIYTFLHREYYLFIQSTESSLEQ